MSSYKLSSTDAKITGDLSSLRSRLPIAFRNSQTVNPFSFPDLTVEFPNPILD
jgi:hypothetical protein